MILSDQEIEERCQGDKPMISPFEPGQVKFANGRQLISYGLTSFGYDVRVSNEWKIFTNVWQRVVDPKAFSEDVFETLHNDFVIIPPNSFVLGRSIETLNIPRDVLVLCIGKSTYARCGIIVNVTPLEPEWRGHITIEISNTTPLPAKIYAGEGIMQLIFMAGNPLRPCKTSYADRSGKYQDQVGVVLPRV